MRAVDDDRRPPRKSNSNPTDPDTATVAFARWMISGVRPMWA